MILALIIAVIVTVLFRVGTKASDTAVGISGIVAAVLVLVVVYNSAKPKRFMCFSQAQQMQKLVAMPPGICRVKT